MLFSRKKTIVGLDLGSSAIKLVHLKEAGKGFQLVKMGMRLLPPEVVVDGAIMNLGEMTEAIKSLVSEQKLKGCDVVLSVSGHSVIIKRISLPVMTEEELTESIKWEAEQYIPFAIDDVNLDFQILGRPEQEGQMDVLLVAAKKDKITDYLTAVSESGLMPVVVDVDAFALENMYEINYEIESNEIVALVNIGASVMNINIVKGGVSSFTRDSSVGGNQYTEAIQKDFNLTYDDAERVKKGVEVKGVNTVEVQALLASLNEDIASEIARSFDFFRATSTSDDVTRVILSGGGAKVAGLVDVVSHRLEIPAELANPFKNIAVDAKLFDFDQLQDMGPHMGVAVGLAMRRVGDR